MTGVPRNLLSGDPVVGDILVAHRFRASREGAFCQPASAPGVAETLEYRDELPEGPIVCTLTGHGLKDPETAVIEANLPGPVTPRLDAVLDLLGW